MRKIWQLKNLSVASYEGRTDLLAKVGNQLYVCSLLQVPFADLLDIVFRLM